MTDLLQTEGLKMPFGCVTRMLFVQKISGFKLQEVFFFTKYI